jgi:hypothetical protein
LRQIPPRNGRIAVQGALNIVNDAAASDDCRMKIAVPLFGNRVSPHFGASSRILFRGEKRDHVIGIYGRNRATAGHPAAAALRVAGL